MKRIVVFLAMALMAFSVAQAESEQDSTFVFGPADTETAAPELTANSGDAALIHEAAIGKIAGEQLLKLRTLGLTEEEAEAKIVEGFLK